MARKDPKTQNDTGGYFSEQENSLATFTAENTGVLPLRVQGTVETWLEQGRDLTLPFHHYEPPKYMVNNINPQANKEQPGGL